MANVCALSGPVHQCYVPVWSVVAEESVCVWRKIFAVQSFSFGIFSNSIYPPHNFCRSHVFSYNLGICFSALLSSCGNLPHLYQELPARYMYIAVLVIYFSHLLWVFCLITPSPPIDSGSGKAKGMSWFIHLECCLLSWLAFKAVADSLLCHSVCTQYSYIIMNQKGRKVGGNL